MNKQVRKDTAYFHDIDSYAKSICLGHVEHYQLEPGPFYGKLCQVESDNVKVATLQSNRTLLEIGHALNGFTIFLLPGNMKQDFSWRKQRLTGQRIGLLKSQMPHKAVIPPNFFGTPIGISNSYLKKLIIEINFNDKLYQLIQQTEVVELEAEEAITIQEMVIDLCKKVAPDWRTLHDVLPVKLLRSLEKQAEKLPKQLSGSRDLMFNDIIQFIENNLNDTITTQSICENLDISERNLRYLFRDLTGLSPMKFLKNLRLNYVRKEIKSKSDKKEIGKIASKWGFNHSGQFAADYKKLFDVFPSQTINSRK